MNATRRLTFEEWQKTRRMMTAVGFAGSVNDWIQLLGQFSRAFRALAEQMTTQIQNVAAPLTRAVVDAFAPIEAALADLARIPTRRPLNDR